MEEVALSEAEQADEMLLMGLRIAEGVDLQRLVRLSGVQPSRATIEGLVAEDPSGMRIAEVGSVRTEKSLASLLFQRNDLGVIHLQRPHARWELRPDGSNVEDAVTAWLVPLTSVG